ncbi:polyisoprenoid-binding protein YceI [Gillisia mitskevichiae]|uniref:Polyisoprenoid-binding protein YceI n=1 Tax=Gillisia mitskevichiae TaxID=270921 RepID=A0A495P795_9FLAO|nr:YceI family protein [Gillisia mitskevichiae]RKS45082.1 polyisoprenoid-binding protein YceI [Gillisia mitskevichiae]
MKKSILNIFTIAAIGFAVVGCKNENKEAETTDAQEVADSTMEAASFEVDTTSSVINWQGEKPTGTHTGTIKLTEGTFKANDSVIESGTFVIDMNSINVTDLEGDDKLNLEKHLKGTVEGKEGDFYNVTKYPTGTFEVTGVSVKDGKTMLQGNLTLKDVTKNVEFPVTININEDTLELTSEKFNIDRTKWNVNYGSKSVFDGLGDKFINDEIELMIEVKAKKA